MINERVFMRILIFCALVIISITHQTHGQAFRPCWSRMPQAV